MVNYICLQHQLFPLFYTSPQCTGIQDTLRFWIPCCGFQIPDTKLQILCQRILDFNHYWDSRSLKKYSGLQKPGIPDSGIPDSKTKTSWILVFRFPNVG